MRDCWREINNAKADELWSAKLEQLFQVINFSLEKGFWEPALILIYAGIDALAWLDRRSDSPDVSKSDFIGWCDRCLLLPADAELSAEDLYAARCGLVHTYTGESKLHRQEKVTKLFYSRKTPTGEVNLEQLNGNEHVWPLWVDIDLLVKRFRDGVARYREAVAADPQLTAKVYDRVNHSYLVEIDVPKRVGRAEPEDDST
jgi:hypothetical protein